MGKKGAKIIGQFNLNQGYTLNIIVGQSGEDSDGGVKGGGGGGGTFVYINNSETPLIIAGGGGGISYNSGNWWHLRKSCNYIFVSLLISKCIASQ